MSSGISDKEWRGLFVDSEMKDSWLERLNDIPAIEIKGTCAGHSEYEMPRSWIDKILSPRTVKMTSPEHGPYVGFATSFEQPLRRIADIFGKLMLYDETGCFNLEALRGNEESYVTKMAYVEHCPPEKIFHMIPWVPEAISIRAIMYRSEMSTEQFDQWWEIVISGLEQL